MAQVFLSSEESTRARQIWSDYLATHDVSDRVGQTVGIDPATGQVWFGENIPAIVAERATKGLTSPLRFERVGADAYYRKGCRR